MPQGISIVEGAILQSMAADVEGPTEDIDREGFADLLRLPGARRLAERLAELTDGEQEIIERFLRDVAIYLVYARRDIQRMLRTALRKVDGDLILVGHSLGSVVAHELLEDKAIRQRTVAFVTLGSPLGIQGVYKNLAKPGTHHPGTPAWLTVYDPLDFVAIGHPIKRLYGEPLDEMSVRNPRGEAHSVERYLGHQAVASWIGNHLGA
jgi:endonuclease G